MEWFGTLPVLVKVLIVTLGSMLVGGYILFGIVRAIALRSVNRELDKYGLLSTGVVGFYVSRQVYKIHVDDCPDYHSLGDSLHKYKFCAEPDGYILLRVCGGMGGYDYPPSWPDHELRCVLDVFGSTGVFAPNGSSDNIVSVYERELTSVSVQEYEAYLEARKKGRS